ncbi:unnamed protein product [Phytophthora lilii]|uniref:Unnamed protein product n=1 Tax=Phytophthora lilii TaxID=2077276 RepID=A0A9W7CR42_9STRA|nr:unnamed protein product [Phytophthora lilii]
MRHESATSPKRTTTTTRGPRPTGEDEQSIVLHSGPQLEVLDHLAVCDDIRQTVSYFYPDLPQSKYEVAFKIKAPDRTELCKWIFSRWSAVATSTIAAGFRKCGLIERGCGENEETEAETAPVQENADDIVHEMLEAGALDMEVGEFSLDDDFDDMFRSVADINLQQ